MDHMLFCASCDEVVVKSNEHSTKIRSKVIVIRDDSTFAVCKGCGKELELPVSLEIKKSVSQASTRLYVKK